MDSPYRRHVRTGQIAAIGLGFLLFGFFSSTLFSLQDSDARGSDSKPIVVGVGTSGGHINSCDPSQITGLSRRHNPHEHHDDHWADKVKPIVKCQLDLSHYSSLVSAEFNNTNFKTLKKPQMLKLGDTCDTSLPDNCVAIPSYEWKASTQSRVCSPVCRSFNESIGACGPSFFIIGAQKAATTSLFSYISKHPHFRRPMRKELHYYDRDDIPTDPSERIAKYLAMFPKCKDCITGEASPSYSMMPDASKNIHQDWPNARAILIVRNPTSRAVSHYRMLVTPSWKAHHTFDIGEAGIDLNTFTEEIGENMRRLREEQLVDEVEGTLDLSRAYPIRPGVYGNYLERGMYASIIESWLKVIPSSQLLVIKYEDLVDSQKQLCVLRQVLRFVGLQYQKLDHRMTWSLPHENGKDANIELDDDFLTKITRFFRPFNHRLNLIFGKDVGYPD